MQQSVLFRAFILIFSFYFAPAWPGQDPYNAELMGEITRMEKSELHIHIGGAWPLEYLKSLATQDEITALEAMLQKIQGRLDYHEAFKVFGLISKIINSDERVEAGVAALCKELSNDGVTYVELRTGLKDLGSGYEGHLQSVLRGIEKGTADCGLDAPLLLSLRRDTPEAIAELTVDLALAYRGKGVLGLDLSGDSTVGDGKGIFKALLRAKEAGLPIALHLGESQKEDPVQQLLEVTLLEPQRIGHGVHLAKEVRDWIIERKIPIEMCLTSAYLTGMVDDPKDHPALHLMREGHPVTIATDDPLIFKTTLSKELALAASLLGVGLPYLQENQRAAVDWRFR